MGYGDYAPMADKFLLPDGSITTFDNVEVSPANAARALLYTQRASAVAKWLMPDGSIVSGLPVTIQGGELEAPLNYIAFSTTPTGVPTDQGTLSWNEQDKTLDLNLGSGVKLQIGQEQFIRVVNKTGAPLLNGTVVYINDAQGNRPTAAKAINTDSTQCNKVIGIVTADIADNNEGYVTTEGLVRDLNTDGLNEGDLLYLSDVAGEYTSTIPAVGKGRLQVGVVVKSHITDGWIYVRIVQNKYRFGDVANGNYSYFEDGGVLVKNGTATTWKDIDFPIIIRQTGANIPVLTTVQGNITAPQWEVNDLNVCEGQEFIHEWKEGSEVRWHLHMLTNGLDTSDRYVKWEVEWFWVKPDEVISANNTQSYEFKIPANTATKTMFIVPIYQWTPTDGKIGGHCYARLRRIASTGLAPSNNPWCTMLQLHVECDTDGSREYQTK